MGIKFNERKIQSDVIEYLSNKYSDDFEIISGNLIIEPAKKTKVNIVCKDFKYDRPFRVFHFLDSSSVDFSEDEELGGNVIEDKAEITDEYGGVVLSEKYSKILNEMLGDDIYVFCEIGFDEFMPSLKDLNCSFENGIKNWGYEGVAKIYIYYDKEKSSLEEVLKKATNIVPEYDISMQYVYICSLEHVDTVSIRKDYFENWNDYEEHIVEDEAFKKIDGFYTTSDDGVKNIQVIKE